MNTDIRFLILGLIGVAMIVGSAIWYFLAPAGRRPAADNVRDKVRERMRPVMFADTLPAPRHELTVPPSRELVAHAANLAIPAWAGPIRVAVADRPQPVPVRPAHVEAYTLPGGHDVIDEMHEHRITPAAGDGREHEGATEQWSPRAELAAAGPGSLLAYGVPEVSIDDLTEAEIDDARWDEEWRKFDETMRAESWRVSHAIATTFGPAVAVEALAIQQRDQAIARHARQQAMEWATGELNVPTARTPKMTDAQRRRARKQANKLKARIDRVLVEVGS